MNHASSLEKPQVDVPDLGLLWQFNCYPRIAIELLARGNSSNAKHCQLLVRSPSYSWDFALSATHEWLPELLPISQLARGRGCN